ncbi:hypothetical protein LXL04_004382 [Taraxacum kok-saghyz]
MVFVSFSCSGLFQKWRETNRFAEKGQKDVNTGGVESVRLAEVEKTLDMTMVKAVSPGKVGNNGETTRTLDVIEMKVGCPGKVEMVREKTRMLLLVLKGLISNRAGIQQDTKCPVWTRPPPTTPNLKITHT